MKAQNLPNCPGHGTGRGGILSEGLKMAYKTTRETVPPKSSNRRTETPSRQGAPQPKRLEMKGTGWKNSFRLERHESPRERGYVSEMFENQASFKRMYRLARCWGRLLFQHDIQLTILDFHILDTLRKLIPKPA